GISTLMASVAKVKTLDRGHNSYIEGVLSGPSALGCDALRYDVADQIRQRNAVGHESALSRAECQGAGVVAYGELACTHCDLGAFTHGDNEFADPHLDQRHGRRDAEAAAWSLADGTREETRCAAEQREERCFLALSVAAEAIGVDAELGSRHQRKVRAVRKADLGVCVWSH